jgi:L-ascorbate metabolism protein UlaG (beta-lactamase superfamily)
MDQVGCQTRLEVRWFPPSWLLLRNGNGTVGYVDPAWIQNNFRRHPGAVRFTHWPEPMDGLPEPGLPTADVVMVTHHHQDHVKTATLRRLCRKDTVVLAPARCADLLGRPFRVVNVGDQVDIEGFEIRVVPAHNVPEGRSVRKQHRDGECVGYVVGAAGATVYHAGDTDLLPEMSKLGAIDIAFLPIGGTFTMDVEEAVRAATAVGARLTVPIHHGKADPADFVAAATERGRRARVLAIGESVRI